MDFSPEVINRFYRTLEVENDSFSQMLDDEVDWNEVLDIIRHSGSHWAYHTQPLTKPRHLENKFLNKDAWIWLQVVLSRLRPVTHTSSITPDHCILLHYLVTGQDINLGKAIRKHIQHVANSTATLAFPCTITTMAVKAGVVIHDDEEIALPDDSVDNAIVNYVFRRAPPPPAMSADEKPHQDAQVPPPPPPKVEPTLADASAEPIRQNVQLIFHELRVLRQELCQIELAQNLDHNRTNREFWALSQQLTSVAIDMRTLEEIMCMLAPPDLVP